MSLGQAVFYPVQMSVAVNSEVTGPALLLGPCRLWVGQSVVYELLLVRVDDLSAAVLALSSQSSALSRGTIVKAGAFHAQGRCGVRSRQARQRWSIRVTYNGCGLRRLHRKTIGLDRCTRACLLCLTMFALNLRILVSGDLGIRTLGSWNVLGLSWRWAFCFL